MRSSTSQATQTIAAARNSGPDSAEPERGPGSAGIGSGGGGGGSACELVARADGHSGAPAGTALPRGSRLRPAPSRGGLSAHHRRHPRQGDTCLSKPFTAGRPPYDLSTGSSMSSLSGGSRSCCLFRVLVKWCRGSASLPQWLSIMRSKSGRRTPAWVPCLASILHSAVSCGGC